MAPTTTRCGHSPDGKRIAFTSGRSGNDETYVMDANGGHVRRIAHSSGDDENPSWSPNGTRLASCLLFGDQAGYVYSRVVLDVGAVDDTGIHVIDRDGSRDGNVTASSHIEGGDPFWGREGIIFFDSQGRSSDQIATVDAPGGPLGLLTDPSAKGDSGQARWSPDGKRVAFTRDVSDDSEVWVTNADGSGAHDVSSTPSADDEEPAWSPDGRRIAFATARGTRDDNFQIFGMNDDGSSQANLTRSGTGDFLPSWSPDGRRIAFTRVDGGNADIHVMDADGSNQTRLTTSESIDAEPAWSPDGTKIAFASDRDGAPQIYVMNADGSNLHQLVSDAEEVREPAWSPDGTKIVFDRVF